MKNSLYEQGTDSKQIQVSAHHHFDVANKIKLYCMNLTLFQGLLLLYIWGGRGSERNLCCQIIM